jgi:hypothetical protein
MIDYTFDIIGSVVQLQRIGGWIRQEQKRRAKAAKIQRARELMGDVLAAAPLLYVVGVGLYLARRDLP